MGVFKQKIKGKPYSKWTIEITDHLGVTRRFQAFTDKAASEELGRKLERLVAFKASRRTLDAELTSWLESCPPRIMRRLATLGLVDGQTSAAVKPLAVLKPHKSKHSSKESLLVTGGHLADYQSHLQNRELNSRYIQQAVSHCSQLIYVRNLSFISDITPEEVELYLAELRKSGASARTVNSTLTDFGTFCRWLVKHGRMTSNPTSMVNSRLNEKVDRRVIRRPLTIDEIRFLIQATEESDAHHGLSGRERALVYRLALETGLRYGEIQALQRLDFQLSSEPFSVHIRAEDEKAGRGDILPIRPELAQDLLTYFSESLALPNSRAFLGMWKKRGSNMIRKDLDRAGVDWHPNEAGAVIDFHSLRHTFASLLASSGVHPKVAQELMRHSDINLTMSIYSHVLINDRAKATAALPDFTQNQNEAKTGTSDIPPELAEKQGDLQGVLQGVFCPKTADFGTNQGSENTPEEDGVNIRKTPENTGFSGVLSMGREREFESPTFRATICRMNIRNRKTVNKIAA